MLEERIHAIFVKSRNGIDNFAFSLSIDATRVPKAR